MRANWHIRTLVVLLALMPVSARADKKEDLANQAKSAAAAGKVFEAKDAYCQLADLDANYPQAKMMCSVMTKEADREQARCDDRWDKAMQDINASKFDDAEQKLKNVKQGCRRYDEARAWLGGKLAQAKKDSEAKAGEAVMAQKFEQGSQAYEKNDFNAARSALGQVTGPKAGDAQALLNKIKQYEQAMGEADRLAGSNPKRARDLYLEAAKLKANGPGDPNGKAQKALEAQGAAEQAAAKAAEEAARKAKKPSLALQVSPTSGQASLTVNARANGTEGGTRIVGTQIQWGDGSQTDGAAGSHVYKNAGTYDVVAWVTDEAGNKVSQVQTVRVIEAAVKVATPEVDVAKTLAEARAAQKKGELALARGKYMKVLSADKANKEALDALDALSKQAASTPTPAAPAEPQTPGVISEADTLLAKGITEFYTGAFDDAYSDLRDYLKFKGEKVGLANFYMGALKATQYHLGGGTDQKLADAANNAFRAAKKAPKFRVPEKYISPKIVAMYNGVS